MKSPSRIAKNLVRAILAKRGLEITRRLPENGPPLPVFRLLLEQIIATDGKGTILQIGANDGMVHDPVHEIISDLSLPAILVEPLPDLFERLVRNYKAEKNVEFDNVAISTHPGKAQIFRVASDPAFPDWVQGIASFDRSILTSHNRLLPKPLDNYITSLEVPIITIKQLLEKHGNPSIAALQIDTEGHDFAVIRSALDAECLPRIINYESKHLKIEDQVECRELLASRGYSFLTNFADTLAYRGSVRPSISDFCLTT
jgi:FkbM family methyltransferase